MLYSRSLLSIWYIVVCICYSILSKWLYFSRQSTDLMQSLSNYNGIFHRTRTNNPKIYMETQKTLNSQSNVEKEKQSWRNQAPWLQTILLQSYNNLWTILSLFLYMVWGSVLISLITCSCPACPTVLVEKTVFSPLYILAFFVID